MRERIALGAIVGGFFALGILFLDAAVHWAVAVIAGAGIGVVVALALGGGGRRR